MVYLFPTATEESQTLVNSESVDDALRLIRDAHKKKSDIIKPIESDASMQEIMSASWRKKSVSGSRLTRELQGDV
jgi:hypothetical protein